MNCTDFYTKPSDVGDFTPSTGWSSGSTNPGQERKIQRRLLFFLSRGADTAKIGGHTPLFFTKKILQRGGTKRAKTSPPCWGISDLTKKPGPVVQCIRGEARGNEGPGPPVAADPTAPSARPLSPRD